MPPLKSVVHKALEVSVCDVGDLIILYHFNEDGKIVEVAALISKTSFSETT